MLSTKEIKNTQQASHYFMEKDNYYSREEGIQKSEWYGKGADHLQLRGEIDTDQFNTLLEGRLPNGQQLGKKVDGDIKHRAGWDLTFSASKSVSILALISGDKRLFDAHRQAVAVALADIERGCSQARVRTASNMVYQNTQNIVASLFHHDLSRAQDPQLHTHCVVFNMTQRADGHWRSQASQLGDYREQTQGSVNGFIERVRHHKRYYGQLYRNELAYNIKQLGYELTVDKKAGLFEIAGISREVIDHFSQRRRDIETYLEKHDLTGGTASAVATLNTREKKTDVNREQLLHEWQQRLDVLGTPSNELQAKCLQQSTDKNTSSNLERSSDEQVLVAVQKAVHDLSLFKTTFTLEEIILEASDYVIRHHLKTESALNAIKKLVSTGVLIDISNNSHKTHYIAQSTLDAEQQLIQILKEENNNTVIIDKRFVEMFTAQHSELTLFQRKNLQHVLGKDRFIIIEGEAAKNVLVAPVVQLAKSARLSVTVLSPSAVGSKKLSETLTSKPRTLWEHLKAFWQEDVIKHDCILPFLSRYSVNNEPSIIPRLIMVDQAHLIPTQQMLRLAQWSVQHNAKLLLIGNEQTLLPQQSGNPFHQFIENGVKVIRCTSQSHEKAPSIPLFKEHFEKMMNRLVEVKQEDERYYAMAEHYARLSPQERQKTWLVSFNKVSRDQLNIKTHNVLVEKQRLGERHALSVLIPVYLSEDKRFNAVMYSTNSWVRFNHNNAVLAIKRGDYGRVIKTDKQSNCVWLEKSNGKLIQWEPHKSFSHTKSVELFVQHTREMAIGEQIVLHRSIKDKKSVKGERFTIQDIRASSLTLLNDRNQLIRLDLKKPQHTHFDYGYATTLHAISHEKPLTLIAHLPSKSYFTHQRSINQLMSQAKQCWFYTDDIVTFCKQLEDKTGNRFTAQTILEHSKRAHHDVMTLCNILRPYMEKSTKGNTTSVNRAIEAIEYAIQHVAERDAGFTHKHIMEVALQHAIGDVNTAVLTESIQAAEKAGILRKGNYSEGTLWTTFTAIKMEQDILRLANKDKGSLSPIASDITLQKYSDSNVLNTEQIIAVKCITQSQDRVLAVQGYAGTGKTTLLQTVQSVLKEHDFQLWGLVPTHAAVNELKSQHIFAQTLDSFLVTVQSSLQKNTNSYANTLFVLDEASLVSNRKMVDLLHIIHRLESRLLVVGDTRQLAAIEAGKPQSLIQTQVETVQLTHIKRQHDLTLKQAVKETIAYDFKAAFKTLEKSITEINEKTIPLIKEQTHTKESLRQERLKCLVEDYMQYPKEQRESILIITPGHDDRRLVNALIREQLREEGSLTGQSLSTTILVSRSLTAVERSHPSNYSVGEVLRFGKSSGTSFKAGDYATITQIDQEHRLLTLLKADGREVAWQIPHYQASVSSSVEVFNTEPRALQVGDCIRWTRTDKSHALLSAEVARITAIDKHLITLELANQSVLTMDTRQSSFQHWDHGYASTVYAAQGKTKSIVLAHLESYRTHLMTQPAFLVSLTRAVDSFHIYTDNKQQMLARILKNTGIKRSSLEVIGEYPSSKSDKINQPATIPRPKKTVLDAFTTRQIRQRLNEQAEPFAVFLLGKPVSRSGQCLRFGSNKGSLIVTINGSKQGLWYDFSPARYCMDKSGGDMLKLLQSVKNLSTREALKQGAEWLHLPLDKESLSNTKQLLKSPNQLSQKRKSPSVEQKKSIAFARKLAHQSRPLKRSLGEKYLQQHRAITQLPRSKDIRFHPGIYSKINNISLPALLVIARDKEGLIQAVQAIYLDEKTAQKASSPLTLSKQTFGVLKGALVTLQTTKHPITLIAEGPETGLSLAQSIPEANVKVTLGKGNFLNVNPQSLTEKVIFCVDNDGGNMRQDPLLLAAAKRLVEEGKMVSLMAPNCLGNIKQDYNDVLRQPGKLPIRDDFNKALSYEEFFKNSVNQSLQNGRSDIAISPLQKTLSTDLHASKASQKQPQLDQNKAIPPRQKEVEIER